MFEGKKIYFYDSLVDSKGKKWKKVEKAGVLDEFRIFQFSWKNPLYVLLPRKLVLSNVSRFFQEILEKSFFDENIKNGPVESILSYKYSFSIP